MIKMSTAHFTLMNFLKFQIFGLWFKMFGIFVAVVNMTT